jgi:hypothetical protein
MGTDILLVIIYAQQEQKSPERRQHKYSRAYFLVKIGRNREKKKERQKKSQVDRNTTTARYGLLVDLSGIRAVHDSKPVAYPAG